MKLFVILNLKIPQTTACGRSCKSMMSTHRFFRVCQLQLLQQELYSYIAHVLSLMSCTWTSDFTDNATITKCTRPSLVLNETASDLVHCIFYIKYRWTYFQQIMVLVMPCGRLIHTSWNSWEDCPYTTGSDTKYLQTTALPYTAC